MNRKPLLYFSLFIGLISFTIAYCVITQFHIPLPYYYPALNQWSMVTDPNLPSMGWYAQTVASLLIGGVSGGLAYLLGLFRQPISEDALPLQIVGWIAVAAAILMMLYIFQSEWRHWIVGDNF